MFVAERRTGHDQPLPQAGDLADAAYAILTKPSRECTGNFFIDEELLRAEGVSDFDRYAVTPGVELNVDFVP